jgi:hypothetical protein
VSATRYPFPPRVGLRVGVSGHRHPPKLPKQSEAPLRITIDRLLAVIGDTARKVGSDLAASPRDTPNRDQQPDPSSPKENAKALAIVSSLAEGSDRLVAEAGLAAGLALEVILPLPRAEYARDFATPESRARFEELLARASAVVELPGNADTRPAAYQAAGLVMLARIDLLVAVWDGEQAAGLGGTAQIVSGAMADGLPVVRINPIKPNAMQIARPWAAGLPPADANVRLNDIFQSADEATIALLIKEILFLPTRRGTFNSFTQPG